MPSGPRASNDDICPVAFTIMSHSITWVLLGTGSALGVGGARGLHAHALETLHATVSDHAHRLRQPDEAHAILLGEVVLEPVGGHLGDGAPIDDGHFFGAQAP